MLKFIVLYLKAFFMGTADLIPGVSGGTIALLVGVYEHLVDCIAATVSRENLRFLLHARFASYFRAIDGAFLLTIVLGICTAIFSLARFIQYLLIEHTIPIESFFFGLMLATVLVVGRKVASWSLAAVVLAVLGTAVGLLLNFGTPIVGGDSSLWYVFSGAIAICAMILPGISGSFILILLGMYARVLHLVVTLNIAHLGVFALGALLGLLLFSRFLSWLFARYKNQMLALLSGFILGAMVRLWPWKEAMNERSYHLILLSPQTYSLTHDAQVLLAASMALVGFVLVVLLEKHSHPKAKSIR